MHLKSTILISELRSIFFFLFYLFVIFIRLATGILSFFSHFHFGRFSKQIKMHSILFPSCVHCLLWVKYLKRLSYNDLFAMNAKHKRKYTFNKLKDRARKMNKYRIIAENIYLSLCVLMKNELICAIYSHFQMIHEHFSSNKICLYSVEAQLLLQSNQCNRWTICDKRMILISNHMYVVYLIYK